MRQLLIVLFSFLSLSLYSQDASFLIVDEIVITGNEYTNDHVLLKELDFKPGDTLRVSEIGRRRLYNEKRLLATALFTSVTINITNWDFETHRATVTLDVSESWYIYPSLILETADRNFNVWFFDMDRDLSRINYGLGLRHINLTGNKDALRLKFQRGYTNKYEAKYTYPYISRDVGVNAEVFYADYDEIGYATIGNKTVFASAADNRTLLKRFRMGGGVDYRPDARNFVAGKLTYHDNDVNDFVLDSLNRFYFQADETNFQMFTLQLSYTFSDLVFDFFPEGGYLFAVRLEKEGLGIFDDYNNLNVQLEGQYYFNPWERVSMGLKTVLNWKANKNNIPFASNTGLGYEEDLVRGYELYVIDGSDWVLGKWTTRYQFLNTAIDLGNYMPIKAFRTLPLEAFIHLNVETGYVRDERFEAGNPLNNEWVMGYGPGLDLLVLHTFLFSVEYNRNLDGEGGLYFKSTFNF